MMSSNIPSDANNPLNSPLLTSTESNASEASQDELESSLVKPMGGRFRGFLPVVIDMETGGFNHHTDALLEVAAVTLSFDNDGMFHLDQEYQYNIQPFSGAVINPEEFENGKKQYFPQPGDDPTTIAQKRQNRQIAQKAIREASGVAGPSAGDDISNLSDDELRAIINGG